MAISSLTNRNIQTLKVENKRDHGIDLTQPINRSTKTTLKKLGMRHLVLSVQSNKTIKTQKLQGIRKKIYMLLILIQT